MSCFRVATSMRDAALIEVGVERGRRGLHIERARLDHEYLRPTLVRLAREANHRMVAAMRRVQS